MADALRASYDKCQRIARRSKSNFFFTFYLLSREKRLAMCALYAFLRRVDDLADEPLSEPNLSVDELQLLGQLRQQNLKQLRVLLNDALSGRADDPTLPALADTVKRYQIPREYLHAAIDGAERDLTGQRYETFEELQQYCYQVASVVGLSCIHIWGFRNAAAFEPAKASGIAFQMTNILRDLKADAAADRIYLPREDLRRFDYHEAELRNGVYNEPFARLMEFEINRTNEFYTRGQELNAYLYDDGRRIFTAMTAVYHRLLEEIARRRGDVFSRPVRLSRWRKASLAARALLLPSRPIRPLVWHTAQS